MHKVATRLVRDNQVVVIEDLSVNSSNKNNCVVTMPTRNVNGPFASVGEVNGPVAAVSRQRRTG
ncbi:hypothetical protein FDZ84_20790 [Saccharopolyspora sp. ASAGF58]|nr:hypothetical protein FDZ84_20790 [Saccharopolyspora sp. ASAGF58]